MKRKMITGERIMYINASTSLNCVFTAKIRGSILADSLHAALGKIQKKHPLLRSLIKDSGRGGPYFVSAKDILPIPVRVVVRKGDNHWEAESKTEWIKLFNDRNAPMARVVWLQGKDVSELMLVCPHCICDGRSILTLMEELLLLIDHPEKELEPYAPFNSVQELLSEKYSFGKLIRVRLLSVLAVWFLFTKSRPETPLRGNPYMLHWKLTRESTDAIATACKRTGTTVHAVLCVAFLEAFRLVKAEQARGNAVSPVDIRKYVPEIKDDMMFAMAPTVEVSLDQGQASFWVKAKLLSNQLRVKIDALKGRESLLLSEYLSADRIVKYLKTAGGTHDITVSNMGRLTIPEKYDSFELETIYSPTVAFPWKNPTTALIHTFRGRMDFTFCSNDRFLRQEEAEQIRDTLLGLLLKGAEEVYAAI